jgi:Na+-transporting methylmalonyl-CoA/oxaloacetate decarboxylase gamma subunit
MARARGSAAGGLAIALTVTGIGFVVCLFLAILFYTRIAAAEAGRADAEQQLNQFATRAEIASPDIKDMLAADKSVGSVVNQLREENRYLKRLITGIPDSNRDRIGTQLKTENIAEDVNLIQEIKRLNAEHRIDRQTIENLQTAAKAAEDRVAQADRDKRQLAEAYESSRKQLTGDVTNLKSSQQKYETQVASASQSLKDDLVKLRTDSQQQVTALNGRVAQLEEEKRLLAQRLDRYEREAKQESALGRVDPSTLPDGQIVSILSEDNLVYIDRGREHRMLMGMTFAVFNRVPGIVQDEKGEYKGKAKIEVVQVNDRSSLARVVESSRGETLVAGDIIANAVYDPNMTFRFYVHGDYDIEGLGQATVGDRRWIETMIRQWGGELENRPANPGKWLATRVDDEMHNQFTQLATRLGDNQDAARATLAALMMYMNAPQKQQEAAYSDAGSRLDRLAAARGRALELSYDVDFLVLGMEPELPVAPDPDETDPVVLENYKVAREKYLTYQSLVNQARQLSVTILNQNRFLTMVGYYRR